MQDTMLLIDGSSLIFRAFYALPPLMNADGLYTNGVYGFLTMYEKLMAQFEPRYVLVAFDRSSPTFRHKDYEAYKGTRQKAPSELAQQFGILKEVLDAMGVPQLDMDGYEADDILGTMSRVAAAEGVRAVLVTGDKDYLQLVRDQVHVYLTRKGITEMEMVDEAHFREKYGIEPRQLIEVMGLMGDPSDNIPGIPGIGEKRAMEYIQNYGSIEGLYENIDKVRGPKTQQTVKEYQQQALLSRKLAEIYLQVPMQTDLQAYVLKEENEAEVIRWFERLGFRSFAKRRTDNREAESFTKAAVIREEEATGLLADIGKETLAYQMLFDDTFYTKGKVRYVLFGKDRTAYLVPVTNTEKTRPFLQALFSEGKRITFDVKESLYPLRAFGVEPRAEIDDLMLVEYLNNPGQSGVSVQQLSRNYLQADLTDPKDLLGKGKNRVSLGEADETALANLAAEIVWALTALYEPLFEKLDSMQMRDLYHRMELPLAYVLSDMEYVGFPIDKEALEELGKEFTARVEALTARIYEAAGHTFNINSTKQLGEILFDELNLPVIKRTKTGYSTDMEVLEALQDSHEIVADILEYRQMQKLQSTYVDGLLASIHDDGRVHTTFRQNIAATGRLSSTEPNIQNIPVRSDEGRRLRKVFVASPGRTLLDADYSQIELRILAHLAQDDVMIGAFADQIDIHTKTAAEVFHRELDAVSSLERSRAKAVNFGIVYGISDYGLSRDLKIPRAEAKEYIDNYLDTYPAIRAYMKEIVEKGKEDGFVETILGRRRYIPELESKNRNIRGFGERIALNTPIQGSAADIIKIAMIGVSRRLREEGLQSQLLLQVHDELIIDTAPGEEEQVEALVKEVMRGAAQLSVPLVVDANFGISWYDAK
ncbi:MAG: DNA polymerase I [Peptoniphilaceae bacterium]